MPWPAGSLLRAGFPLEDGRAPGPVVLALRQATARQPVIRPGEEALEVARRFLGSYSRLLLYTLERPANVVVEIKSAALICAAL